MELVDEVAIHVVMNDKEYTELIIEETPELKEYKTSKDTDAKIRVAFIDEQLKICSQPVAALLLHTLDKTNTMDSINEGEIELNRAIAKMLQLADEDDEAQEPIMLNKYSKVEKMEIVFNEVMSSQIAPESNLLELGNENSVLMISVSNPAGEVDMIKKSLLLL